MPINARDFYGRSRTAVDDDKGNLNPLRREKGVKKDETKQR